MKKINKLALMCGFFVGNAVLLSGCNNLGNDSKSLEVQNHIIAHQGMGFLSSTPKADVRIDFRDIAYGNGIYMIVGSHGSIYTSINALNWIEQRDVTSLNLSAVAYNEKYKKFYAVGDEGKLFSSADGVAWIEYKTLNKNISLDSISVLSDGNEIIGGDSGSIFEVVFRGEDGEKNTVNVREMQSKSGNENSIVTAVASGSEYLVAGSDFGSLSTKLIEDFRNDHWDYSGSNNASGVADIFYNSANSTFISLSKDGYINTNNGNVYNNPWSALSYTGYPSKENYNVGITTNSIAVDHTSPYTFIVGGDKNNRDDGNKDTYIRYTKDITKWSSGDIQYPKTGSLNKIRCFSGAPEPMCIAVGDKKAIVIIKVEEGNVKPEPIDITDPKIIAFEPKNGATDVDRNPVMDITFNKPVENVNNSTIYLYEDHIANDKEVKLSDDFTPSLNKDDYTFKPEHILTSKTKYIVVVESGIHDRYGKQIVGENFTFTTGDISYPEVKSVIPSNGSHAVSVTPNIQVIFSVPVSQVNTTNVTLHESTASGALVAISQPEPTDSTGYVFSPLAQLKGLTTYCAVFGTGIIDIHGTGLKAKYTSCFTTGNFETLDVTMIRPVNNATNVSQLPHLEFKFSRDVTGVNNENVTLHEGSAFGAKVDLGSITQTKDKSYTTFTKSLLKLNTDYYIVFESGIAEVNKPENQLVNTSFNFRTRTDGLAAIATSNDCIYTYTRLNLLTCRGKLPTNVMNKVIYSSSYKKFIAVGDGGSGFAADSNGEVWKPITTKTKSSLKSIMFLNSNEPNVVAVGDSGTIIVSQDAGVSWTLITSPAGKANLKNIYSDGDNFFIAADGGVWMQSSDKGSSWTIIAEDSLPKNTIQRVLNGHGNHRIVGGNAGQVYASSDDAKSWLAQKSLMYTPAGKSAYASFNDFIYLDKMNLNILMGDNGTMFTATDDDFSKDTWERVIDFGTAVTKDLNFMGASVNSDGDIYVVTNNPLTDEGGIFMSTDGIHWIRTSTLRNDPIYSITTVD